MYSGQVWHLVSQILFNRINVTDSFIDLNEWVEISFTCKYTLRYRFFVFVNNLVVNESEKMNVRSVLHSWTWHLACFWLCCDGLSLTALVSEWLGGCESMMQTAALNSFAAHILPDRHSIILTAVALSPSIRHTPINTHTHMHACCG